MTQLAPGLEAITDLQFSALPDKNRARLFGVDYARLLLSEGGELFVTPVGWHRLPALYPKRWFLDSRYAKEGYRLPGATGNVFRIEVPTTSKPHLALVVKFARSGQDVPLQVSATFPGAISESEISTARWNSPFEEFGLVYDLRRGCFGPRRLQIRTKRPLAIYCPPLEYRDWQLGRSSSVWHQMERALVRAQEIAAGPPIHLHESRIYVMLYEWVEGENAEDALNVGHITRSEMISLTSRVVAELERKGFKVLDNKPRHFILRPDGKGGVLRRKGELLYALIDFELLKRTPEYEASLAEGLARDGEDRGNGRA